MKLIVLGAGASFGASRHADVRCPLVGGILGAASALGLTKPDYAAAADARLEALLRSKGADLETVRRTMDFPDRGDHLMILREFVREQFGLSPDRYEKESIDFERLFALVEAELLGFHGLMKLAGTPHTGPRPADVLEMQLFLVLCGSIISAIRDLTCDYHDALARWLKRGDAVLSFNYDLLVDRSLRKRGDWFPEDGYGLRFARIGRRNGEHVAWSKPSKTQSAVGLLKPHGSLNWLYPRDSRVTVLHADVRGLPTRTPPKKIGVDPILWTPHSP